MNVRTIITIMNCKYCLVLLIVETASATTYTRDYCRNLQFDFDEPKFAVSQYKECSDLEPRKNPTGMVRKFTTDWAKYAVDKGLANAINVLGEKEIRKILVPNGEWNGIVRKYTSFTGEDCTSNPLYKIQVPLMVVLVIEIMMLVSFVIIATDIADVIDFL